jgi:hypothetical protein
MATGWSRVAMVMVETVGVGTWRVGWAGSSLSRWKRLESFPRKNVLDTLWIVEEKIRRISLKSRVWKLLGYFSLIFMS